MIDLKLELMGEGVCFFVYWGEEPTTELFPLPVLATGAVPPFLSVLEMLWLRDELSEHGSGFFLPAAAVYDLDPADRIALKLPAEPIRLDIELRTLGGARSPEFRIKAVSRHPSRGILADSARRGPFFDLDGELLLADSEAATLYRAIDDPVPEDVAGRLLFIGNVREAAIACGARMDLFLRDQELIRPEGIGVEADIENGERIKLQPSIHGLDDREFSAFAFDSSTRPAYVEIDRVTGRRRRLVLSPDERRTADKIRSQPILEGADVPRFFDNPEAFLPDEIDISRYGIRVKGIVPKRYQSQPYVRAQRSGQRGWFDVTAEIILDAPDEVAGQASPSSEAAESGSERTRDGAPTLEADATVQTPPTVTPEEYADLCGEVLATGDEFHRLPDGSWIKIDPEEARRFLDLWKRIESDQDGKRRIRAEDRYVLDVYTNVDAMDVDESAGIPTDHTMPDLPDYSLPVALRADLMPHQHFGYRWLRFLHEKRFGGLLADDMGLGKTVQVISLLAFLHEERMLGPTLLVLPNSLIGNWKREIRKFCPDIHRVYVHQGPDRQKDEEFLARWDIVMTTYQTLRRDQLCMGKIDWQVVACDEAQYVKNPTAQSTSVVKAMKARLRLALTGTPVENGLSELWCIVDYVQPGRLGSQREFRNTFERPIRDSEGTKRRDDLARQLQRQLIPHYIRRTKDATLDGLPQKREDRLAVGFGERQLRLYGHIIKSVQREEMIPLEALQKMIMVCSHPELYEPLGRDVDELISECPKLAEAVRILKQVQGSGEKAVVFTRYRRMQLILDRVISAEFGVHAPAINGDIGGERRVEVIERFNERPGFGVLILSPEAAGVGLNITGANHVIHYTRLWNPAKENQATDRVYRIGQQRGVTVYYPIVEGGSFRSVEERLDELLEEKRDLARDVVRPRESLNIQVDEIRDVFDSDLEVA